MSVETVASTKPATAPQADTSAPAAAFSLPAKGQATAPTPSPSGGSSLDTVETLAKNNDPASSALLYDLTGARNEEDMMKAVNANPLAFLGAVNTWANANGITGKSQDQLISLFLGRLRADLGFGTSKPNVPDDHLILLVGSDNRTNATVSAVGQMIYEKYGEAAWKDYRAKVEADWGADGALSQETITMLDDALSTAKANYKPEYDASGALLNPPPDVQIAQLYIQLGKKYGGIEPDVAYNDFEAQVHFQSGKNVETPTDPSVPTPVSGLLKAVQSWLALDKAYLENQRKVEAGEISQDQYLKTESLLAVQIKEARSAVQDAATAANVDPNLMLRKEVALGFALALTDPATSTQIADLARLRTNRDQLAHQISAVGMPLAYPQQQERLATLKNINAEIAKLETGLKAKGMDVAEQPKGAPGGAFGDLKLGVQIVADDKLDQAYQGEKAAVEQAKAPGYADLFAKIDQLAAKRAELAQIDADEAAGVLTPGVAETKRANLKGQVAALEADLTGLATANKLAPDTFTNPAKAEGYLAAAKNDKVGPLFVEWRQLKSDLAKEEKALADMEAAGAAPEDPKLIAQRAKVVAVREELLKTEHKLHDALYGVDPATAAATTLLDQKRAERDAAKAKWDQLNNGEDRAAAADAAIAWQNLDDEVTSLEASPLPPIQWRADFEAFADGAMAAEKSNADAGYRLESDPAYKVGYAAMDGLTKEQFAGIAKFIKSYDDAVAGDHELTEEERTALVAQYREVAAFMPPGFFGPNDTSALAPTDGAFLAVLSDARAVLAGSFTEGAAQRATEITAENEQMVLAADVPTVLAKLNEAAQDGQTGESKLKGESATAHTQYVLQMLGVSLSPQQLDSFLKGGELPPAQQKAMQIAAQFFAQSQGLKLDDAAALTTLRNALGGDMGRTSSAHGVGQWEEYTFAGTDNPNDGPATPQTELLRSLLSVLRTIYAEVFPGMAGDLDKEVPPRFFDGAIVPVSKTTTTRGGDVTNLDHYELAKGNWDPETGQVTGFKDKPWAQSEWTFEVVLTKQITHPGRGGVGTTETLTERVNPNDQARINQLKTEGYAITRVDAKPASEPQRMMGRLLEALSLYMATYKPKYDAEGKLTNPPPIARIAQYYVQTEFSADSSDHPDSDGRFTNYKIDQTGIVMTDAEAIKFMFEDLGLPESDVNALLGIGGQQLGTSSTLYDPQSPGQKIATTVVDSVFTFGLMGLITGLIDKTTTDPLTGFGNNELDKKGRDTWRSEHRDKMDDPSVFSLVFDTLMFAVPEVFGGFVFTAGAAAGRLARRGADVADAATDTTRAATATDQWWASAAQHNPGWLETAVPGVRGRAVAESSSVGSEIQPFPLTPPGSPQGNPHALQDVPDDFGLASRDQSFSSATSVLDGAPPLPDVAPPLSVTAPKTTTTNIYKWSSAATYETPPPNTVPTLTKETGVYTAPGFDGTPTNYVQMKDPEGKMLYVRVDYIEVPATADSAAHKEWHIYNPSAGVDSAGTMPSLVWHPPTAEVPTGEWKMPDTTLLRSPEYQKYIDGGEYFSQGRHSDPGTMPGVATRDDLRYVRGGEPQPPLTGPEVFSKAPRDVLSDNGRKFLDDVKNKERAETFEDSFALLKAVNEKLQVQLQAAKEGKAFWESATATLEKMRVENPGLTWNQIKERNPNLAKEMEKNGAFRATYEAFLPDTPIVTVIDRAKAKNKDATAEIIEISDKINANALKGSALVNDINGEGNGMQTRSPLFVARNTAIAAGIGGVGLVSGIFINKAVNDKPDPAKDPVVKTATIQLGKDAEQQVDVAQLAGTTGKGYTYEIPYGYALNDGVTINKTTGEVTLSSRGDSKLIDGQDMSVTVLIKDAKGNLKGQVTLTVKVEGDAKSKPVGVVVKQKQLEVPRGGFATWDVAQHASLQPPIASYEFEKPATVPSGVTIDAAGMVTAKDTKENPLKSDQSYTVLVKGASDVILGKLTVTITVGK